MSTIINGSRVDVPKPEYSDNLLPKFSSFEDDVTINKTGGATFSTAVYDSDVSFDGSRSILLHCDDDITPLVINFGNKLEHTTTRSGQYIFSFEMRHHMPAVQYFPDELVVNVFCNTILTYVLVFKDTDIDNPMKGKKWYRFGQTLNINAGTVVDYTFQLSTNLTKPSGVADMWIDGLKLEFDDRLLGIPSVYSKSIVDYELSENKQNSLSVDGTGKKYPSVDAINDAGFIIDIGTGWEACVDTTHTSGSPQTVTEGVTALLTNNKGTLFNSQLPLGVTTFFTVGTTKITPDQQNDYMTTDLMFNVKNSMANGYFTVFVDIPSLGERFSQTRVCPKDANTQMGVNISFSHFISSQFKANGGIIKITADKGNLSVYDKQFRFSRTHKAV